MDRCRLTVAFAAMLMASVALGLPGAGNRSTPILAEVRQHLVSAENCLTSGQAAQALAHGKAVLVGGEIPIRIAYLDVPDKRRATFDKVAAQAMATWEDVLGDGMKFRLVDNDREARIVVTFMPKVVLSGEPVAGLLEWDRALSEEAEPFRARMSVRILGEDSLPLTRSAVRHTVTHELGHVFGLEDTDDPSGLMGPIDLARPKSGPEHYEVAAVREIRAQASSIVSQARRLLGL